MFASGALGAAAMFAPWMSRALAQGQSILNVLPRFAMVIGNTKYADAPLKNPGNDAKAIANELQKFGFKVDLKLDTSRVQLANAVDTFCANLTKTKGVGLFYYAGHGAQLGWRNYLIPVDAAIEKLEDMKAKTVDLGALLNGLTKAHNAMNVIILDACRDNPFGTKVPIEQKGLSQFDAPPGSLIAYATSPGNTAGDGEGVNGLYTENLLREIATPNAKIEDVLKRVRLNVRKKSQGAQIPWESTSLEDDFYFLPPSAIRKSSEAEKERQFSVEKADWDKIKDSKNVDDVYAFLTRYPSGFITEQAEFRIEQLQQAKIVTQADRNGILQKPNEERFRVGDEVTYRIRNDETGKFTMGSVRKVEKIEDGLVYITTTRPGGMVTTEIRTIDGGEKVGRSAEAIYQWDPPRVDQPGGPLEVGKRWTARTIQTSNKSSKPNIREDEVRIVALEEVALPVGKIMAFKFVMESTLETSKVKRTYWVEPGWGMPLKIIREVYGQKTTILETIETVARKRGVSSA